MFWHSGRQRPFDLWLILRAWPHKPQAFLETSSQAGHVFASTFLPGNGTTRSDHNTGNSVPYSFRTVRGFFYVSQNYEPWRTARRGLRFYRPCPIRLESLTICRGSYKGSTFYSVIQRPYSSLNVAFACHSYRLFQLKGEGIRNHRLVSWFLVFIVFSLFSFGIRVKHVIKQLDYSPNSPFHFPFRLSLVAYFWNCWSHVDPTADVEPKPFADL